MVIFTPLCNILYIYSTLFHCTTDLVLGADNSAKLQKNQTEFSQNTTCITSHGKKQLLSNLNQIIPSISSRPMQKSNGNLHGLLLKISTGIFIPSLYRLTCCLFHLYYCTAKLTMTLEKR